MQILLNAESYGVGRPNNVSKGLQVIRDFLPSCSRSFPLLDTAADFATLSQVKGLGSIVHNASILWEIVNGMNPVRSCPLINLGGDCGSDLVPIAWLNQKLDGQLQVVWLDAHGDLNTPASSASGAFHGMVLRTLCGEGPTELAPFVPLPLRPAQIILAGIRDLDPQEAEYIERKKLRTVSAAEINRVPAIVSNCLHPEIPAYLHIDYDVLNGPDHPESTFPTPWGLSVEALIETIQITRSTRSVCGLSLTEFAPDKESGIPDALRQLLTAAFGVTL